jgi:hypothetical protein
MTGKSEQPGDSPPAASPAPVPDPVGAALLVNRVAALEKQVQDLQPKRKDFLDRLSQLSPLITGGAIAGVGTLATVYYAASQDELRRLDAMDKFRTYMGSGKSEEDRKFGYFALTKLGQEQFAIELITYKRDQAGKEVLDDLAANGKDKAVRDAAQKGLVILRSSRPGCEVEFTVSDRNSVELLNGWERTNLRDVEVPQLAKVPKGPAGGKVRFNVLAADALRDAWAEIEAKGLLDRVVSWDQGYSPRTVVGTKRLSAHACGLAFDINAAANPYGQTPKAAGTPGSVAELVPIFEKHGFKWGGTYRQPDPGHFEFTVAPEESASREPK